MTYQVRVMGVPLDLGAGRRGVDMGPSALRIARLNTRIRDLDFDLSDVGDVPVTIQETHDAGDHNARYLNQIVAVCQALSDQVSLTMNEGFFPLVLGGDHSVAIGTIAGASRY